MTRLILLIFETLRAHRLLRWTLLAVATALLGLLLTQQSYKEDISDFLPLDHGQQQALQDYQNSAGAGRIYAIFQSPDSLLQPATERFCEVLERTDTAHLVEPLTADDPEVMHEVMQTLYARIPYLLSAADYARMDSLVATPDFVARQLESDKQRLMLPTGGMMVQQIQHDPLNLFTPVLQQAGEVFDRRQTMLLMDSPFGASETEHNALLVERLQQVCDSVSTTFPEVSVHLTGGPVIAVGNARQIKQDSLFSIAIAVSLIFLLLWIAFRSVRNLLLIALSIAWGWLFAMGCLTLIHPNVSIIVIGISSVILGIAVNYPLHLIAHLPHTPDMPSTLKEIAVPLMVGNVTTVGAFLALVPLNSVALRDLGLFSAFLLMGTMLFVLLWLPHMACQTTTPAPNLFVRIGDVQLENRPWLVWTVLALTLVLGYFSFQTSFDADLHNINYMTAEQRQDMELLMKERGERKEEPADLTRWNQWRLQQGVILCKKLREEASKSGFSEDSFNSFYKLIDTEPSDQGETLTAQIVSNLSDHFNYIGWACGFLVFFFLWFSLGSIELALLSFLPMAVSWFWIMGIMSLLGIQFNVVNIILATFIFGQGDDYTIFMTEGCQYEYAYRRKMLGAYKYSIILSALIMLIGIGALITARHPALFSLAEVTIIGMFSVVLMAYLFPPLIFRWLVYTHGKERQRPITLRNLFCRKRDVTADHRSCVRYVADCYRYRGIEISTAVNQRLRKLEDSPPAPPCEGGGQLLCSRTFSSPPSQGGAGGESFPTIIKDCGWGETALYYALMNPQDQFVCIEKDADKLCVARNVAEGRVNNITFVNEAEWTQTEKQKQQI